MVGEDCETQAMDSNSQTRIFYRGTHLVNRNGVNATDTPPRVPHDVRIQLI